MIVAGIDVGGERKGLHAVAAREGRIVGDPRRFVAAEEAASWVREIEAKVVAIDAPCRWSLTGRARQAERQLMEKKIWCFSTPTERIALDHPKKHFHWMLAGARLFAALAPHYALYDGTQKSAGPMVIETFPHAIACALLPPGAATKPKRTVRRKLLEQHGWDTSALASIDFLDAALCALTAQAFAENRFATYGDAAEGFIVVPRSIGNSS